MRKSKNGSLVFLFMFLKTPWRKRHSNSTLFVAYADYIHFFHLLCVLFHFARIALYPEEVVLLQNGSLIYLDTRHLLSQREFCLDVIDDEEGVQTLPLVCAPPDKKRIPHAVFYIYSVGKFFFFLLLLRIVSLFVRSASLSNTFFEMLH